MCYKFFYIYLTINLLPSIPFASNFSHSVGCLYILSTVSFIVQKLFGLTYSHLCIFAFVALAWIQKNIAKTDIKEHATMFSSRSPMVSDLTFKYIIHFNL